MKTKVVENKFGIFVGCIEGECIQISVPARTGNDWKRNTAFLDLPLMDEETFASFKDAICQMEALFKEQ